MMRGGTISRLFTRDASTSNLRRLRQANDCIQHGENASRLLWVSGRTNGVFSVVHAQFERPSLYIRSSGGHMEETPEEKLTRLEAENRALKAQVEERKPGQLRLKVSEKGGLSVYGLGRFPVTLYK